MNTPLRQTFVALMLGWLCAAAGPATQNAAEKLPAGMKSGTYHFVYRGQVRFTIEPAYPAEVSISSPFTGKIAAIKVTGDKPFVLEADLGPGTYWIDSQVMGRAAPPGYLSVNGGQIFIDRNGNASWPLGLEHMLVHVHRMSRLSPSNMEIAASDPTVLTWQAVAGAKRYEGEYRIRGTFKTFKTAVPRYALPPLNPSGLCDWDVAALDDKGQILAGGTAAFFAHGTDAKAAAMASSPPATKATAPVPAAGGCIGLQIMPGSATKDPKNTTRVVNGGEVFTMMMPDETIPAIVATAVAPGSPALGAGLRPGDSIVAVDGKPVPAKDQPGPKQGDPEAFIREIRAMRAGSKMTLTVRRDSNELKLPILIGQTPEPATRPVP